MSFYPSKMKNTYGHAYHYTHVYHKYTHVYHKWQSYHIWFWHMECDQQKESFVIFDFCLAFYPCNNPENQNFEKKCKKPQEILSACYAQHRWQSHDTWFLKHRAQQTEVLVILDNFLPFYPMTQKIKILTKRLEISLFYKGVPKILIICYTISEIWCVKYVIYKFHFGLFFAPLTPPPLTIWKIKILNKWKKTPKDIIILLMCTKNYDHIMYSSWDMVHNRCMDRQMDKQTEKVTYIGECPD